VRAGGEPLSEPVAAADLVKGIGEPPVARLARPGELAFEVRPRGPALQGDRALGSAPQQPTTSGVPERVAGVGTQCGEQDGRPGREIEQAFQLFGPGFLLE
jgi:hypothetical protein